ncbi:MAG: BON domain-containing protein [Pyrinomonadaceae bacterium]|nr:BON domain-containing protein [Pyrinomonadaceae bacterium]
MKSTTNLRGGSSLAISPAVAAQIKKRRPAESPARQPRWGARGVLLQGVELLIGVRCLVSALVLVAGIVCLLTLAACGNGAGDKVDSKGSQANAAAADNNGGAIPASSNSPPISNATTTDKGTQPDTIPSRNIENPKAASIPKPQISSGGSDFSLFTQARGLLGADAELTAENIIIDVKAGVLTLSGTVANAAQKSKAEELMRAVGGVKAVKNRLRISS